MELIRSIMRYPTADIESQAYYLCRNEIDAIAGSLSRRSDASSRQLPRLRGAREGIPRVLRFLPPRPLLSRAKDSRLLRAHRRRGGPLSGPFRSNHFHEAREAPVENPMVCRRIAGRTAAISSIKRQTREAARCCSFAPTSASCLAK